MAEEVTVVIKGAGASEDEKTLSKSLHAVSLRLGFLRHGNYGQDQQV